MWSLTDLNFTKCHIFLLLPSYRCWSPHGMHRWLLMEVEEDRKSGWEGGWAELLWDGRAPFSWSSHVLLWEKDCIFFTGSVHCSSLHNPSSHLWPPYVDIPTAGFYSELSSLLLYLFPLTIPFQDSHPLLGFATMTTTVTTSIWLRLSCVSPAWPLFWSSDLPASHLTIRQFPGGCSSILIYMLSVTLSPCPSLSSTTCWPPCVITILLSPPCPSPLHTFLLHSLLGPRTFHFTFLIWCP